ncbi:MAG: NifU family protein [Pseudomonadota bacterium]
MPDAALAPDPAAGEGRRPRRRPPYIIHDVARRAPARPRATVPPGPPVDLSADELTVIAEVVEQMRPVFQADGGDVVLVDVVGGVVQVRLSGVCADCGAGVLTLAGLQQRLNRALGLPLRVRQAAMSPGAEI